MSTYPDCASYVRSIVAGRNRNLRALAMQLRQFDPREAPGAVVIPLFRLQTTRDLWRRDYKRQWRKANPEKAREYHARSIARQVVSNFVAKQGELL